MGMGMGMPMMGAGMGGMGGGMMHPGMQQQRTISSNQGNYMNSNA